MKRLGHKALRRCSIAAAAVLLYAGLMTFGGCADSFLLHPSVQPINANGAARLMLPGPGGVPYELWTQRTGPRKPEAFVLVFCGNGSRAESEVGAAVWRWEKVPVEVWAVNYPGYGGSAGKAKLTSIAPVALCAYDALKARAGNRPIFVQGHSLGTTAALYVASRRPCAGVVLDNPPPLKKLLLGRYGWWNLWLIAGPVAAEVPPELDALNTAPKVHVPGLFVLADHDELIPPAYHQMVVDAYAGPHQTITLVGGDHNSDPSDAEQAQIETALGRMFTAATTRPATGP